MLRIVKQSVVLPATSRALYAMYLSPRAHGAITGGKIQISARPGSRFLPAGRNRGRIELVHVNVPSHDYHGVNKGWKNYYWKPWRKYLARKLRAR